MSVIIKGYRADIIDAALKQLTTRMFELHREHGLAAIEMVAILHEMMEIQLMRAADRDRRSRDSKSEKEASK